MKQRNLTAKEHAFVAARLRGLGVADSYREAYDTSRMSHETVSQRASDVEHRQIVQDAINAQRKKVLDAASVDMAFVVNEWLTILAADPSELVTTVHDACRHCWGFDHRYQWRDENEWAAECAKAIERGQPAPDMSGGFGFRRLRGPNPECPQCEGEGIVRERIADMRKVSPAARKLFAGVERTKSGLKLNMRSQDGALLNLAKALGGLIENVRHSGAVGVAKVDAPLTPEQRAQVVKGIQELL